MAVDMFLKLGDIKGESSDDKHRDEIDVLSWSWGMEQHMGTSPAGGGVGAGKVSVHDLSVTKYIDKASPGLMLACCNGEHFKEALLTVRKAAKTAIEYLKITLKDVIVSSMAVGGSTGQDRQPETITFNFAEFGTQYTPQKPDGTADALVEVGWSIKRNVKT